MAPVKAQKAASARMPMLLEESAAVAQIVVPARRGLITAGEPSTLASVVMTALYFRGTRQAVCRRAPLKAETLEVTVRVTARQAELVLLLALAETAQLAMALIFAPSGSGIMMRRGPRVHY